MSEDQLERALLEMTEEPMDAGTLDAARARVWEKMTNTVSATCAEFRQDFGAYLGNGLAESRRLLLEDHLSRCPGCRARLAGMKGERTIVAMPLRRSSQWVRWGVLGAAAALHPAQRDSRAGRVGRLRLGAAARLRSGGGVRALQGAGGGGPPGGETARG